jgi:two-component system, LytTR family, response regulator
MHIICIPTSKGPREVPADTIIRVQASRNYSKIYFQHEYPLTVAKVLQWFEDKLPAPSFYRIHRGHIINCQFIREISRDGKKIKLANGEQFSVSRRKKKDFRRQVA